jgi:hypothetical protein
MTTISQILIDAHRESNLVSINGTLSANQETEGLRLLNRVIASLMGYELGEGLTSVSLGDNNIETTRYNRLEDYSDTPANVRVYCNLETTNEIILPHSPDPGARFGVLDVSGNFTTYPLTLVGNGAKIEGATTVTLSTDGDTREWFYRDDLGEWVKFSVLLTTDVSPFPLEFDDLLITLLAMRLNPRAGVQMDGQSGSRYKEMMNKFRSRYRQSREVASELGITRLSLMGEYGNYDFSRGRTW